MMTACTPIEKIEPDDISINSKVKDVNPQKKLESDGETLSEVTL